MRRYSRRIDRGLHARGPVTLHSARRWWLPIAACAALLLAPHAGLGNDGQAVGLGGALQKVAEQPYGQILLGVVAVGLCMYGLYSLVQARYGRLKH